MDLSSLPPATRHLAKNYLDAKSATLPRYSNTDRSEHSPILRDLLAEAGPCIPFPNHIVHGNARYHVAPETIDIAPHEFELAKLIDRLNWVARLALTKECGSGTKRPELLASRGQSNDRALFARAVQPQEGLGLSAAVLQSGNCGDNAEFMTMLARGLDDDTLREMGINLDLSKLVLYLVSDLECDHEYVVLHHSDEMPLEFTEVAAPDDPEQQYERFSNTTEKKRLWPLDSHQLYPMACRYDKSTYDHLEHTGILDAASLGGQPSSDLERVLDLGFARAIRQDMIQRLNLGEKGIDKAILEDFRRAKGIRSEFVDQITREQHVSHYARVDTTRLSAEERAKFQQEIAHIEREIGRKNLKWMYKNGYMEETWVGLCLPENPDATYRNRDTGEILTPTVPPQYFERTERIRWAHDVWKTKQPDRAIFQSRIRSFFTKFDIPPAVEAIERLPFLSALAGARAMHLGDNHRFHLHHVGQLEQAWSSLESWVARMHADLLPQLIEEIHSVGLKEDVQKALIRVRENVHVFSDVMEKLETDVAAMSPAPDEQEKSRITQLRSSALDSPAWQQMAALLTAFEQK